MQLKKNVWRNRAILISLSVITSLNGVTSQANEAGNSTKIIVQGPSNAELEDLKDGYQMCKNTLETCIQQTYGGERVIKAQAELVTDLEKENEKLKNPSFFGSPLFFALIGALAGGVVVGVSK